MRVFVNFSVNRNAAFVTPRVNRVYSMVTSCVNPRVTLSSVRMRPGWGMGTQRRPTPPDRREYHNVKFFVNLGFVAMIRTRARGYVVKAQAASQLLATIDAAISNAVPR